MRLGIPSTPTPCRADIKLPCANNQSECFKIRTTRDYQLTNGGGLGESSLGGGAAATNSRSGASLLLKDLPELERLVSGSSGEHLTVWAQAAVQHSALVSRDLDVLDKSRVAPDAQAVVGEARRRDNLLVRGGPLQAGDLRASIDAVDASARGGIPEVDHTVVATTTGGEEV